MEKGLSERKKDLLRRYGTARPRLGRGARWAATAGAVTHLSGRKELSIPAATLGFSAGVADKILEEAVERDKRLKKLVGGGYEKTGEANIGGRVEPGLSTLGAELRNVDTGPGLLEELFSRKARMTSAARDQLKQLLPAAKEPFFGRNVRVGTNARDASKAVRRALQGR